MIYSQRWTNLQNAYICRKFRSVVSLAENIFNEYLSRKDIVKGSVKKWKLCF